MGTRSIVNFIDDRGACLCAVYQQYDGYLAGVGQALAKFLVSGTAHNGVACLAASYIAHIKTECGGVYMAHVGDVQEYNYTIQICGKEIVITVSDEAGEIGFMGTGSEFLQTIGGVK